MLIKSTKVYRPKKSMPSGMVRSSRFDGKEVIIVSAVKNGLHISKDGQKLVGVGQGDALKIVPNYVDPDFTLDLLREDMPELIDKLEANGCPSIMSGTEIVEALTKGTIHQNDPEEVREALIEGIDESKTYLVPHVVSKSNLKQLDEAGYKNLLSLYEYDALTEDEQEEYDEKVGATKEDYTYRNKVARPAGIIGSGGEFANAPFYLEAGGIEYPIDKDGNIIRNKEEWNKKGLLTQSTAYTIEPTSSTDYFFLCEREVFTSKSRKGSRSNGEAKEDELN